MLLLRIVLFLPRWFLSLVKQVHTDDPELGIVGNVLLRWIIWMTLLFVLIVVFSAV